MRLAAHLPCNYCADSATSVSGRPFKAFHILEHGVFMTLQNTTLPVLPSVHRPSDHAPRDAESTHLFIEGTHGTNRGLDPAFLKLPSPQPLIC